MKTIFEIKKIVVALLIVTTLSAFAQEEKVTTSKKISGGFGHFNFSAQSINIGGLNNLLAASDYGKINPYQASWGGGGNFVIRNFVIGGEGSGYFNSKTSNNFNAIDLNGGYGFFNMGYVVHSGKRSVLYPILGIGTGGYNITVHQKDQNKNIIEQLNTPSGNTTITAGGLLLNAQLAWQYFFYGHQKQGFFVGLKAGYRYSPNSWKLKVNGNGLNDSPNINMNGFNVTLIIGGGSLTKN